MKRLLMTILLIVLFPMISYAAKLQITWNANTETILAGYKVSYGTASGNYTTTVDVGKVTTYTTGVLTNGKTYYVVVKAYNTGDTIESPNSTEVSALIPLTTGPSAPQNIILKVNK